MYKFIILLMLLLIPTKVFATQIDVSWNGIVNVSTKGAGTLGTTEFNLFISSTGENTFGYCLEPQAHTYAQAYNFSILPLDYDFSKEIGFFKAAWLIDQFAPGASDVKYTDASTRSAALQVLIWQVTNGNSYTLTSGGQIASYYNQYNNSLSHLVLSDTLEEYLLSNYYVAHNNECQDLLVSHHDPVPEPATLMLLGSGILILSRKIKNGKRKILV